MSLYLLILETAAVWRITHLLSKEDGPFDIIFIIRRKAGSGFFGNLILLLLFEYLGGSAIWMLVGK